MTHPTQAQLRWIVRRDMDDVLAIDRMAFSPEDRWDEAEWLTVLRQRNGIGTVCETNHDIHGAMVYSLHKSFLFIERVVVRNTDRRKGYGTQMVQRLIDKLTPQKRLSVETVVPEHMVGTQLFFASMGFVAVAIVREGIRMVWSLEPELCKWVG